MGFSLCKSICRQFYSFFLYYRLQRRIYIAQSNIYDGAFIFREKAPLQMFDWVLNTEAVARRLLEDKVFLKISQNFASACNFIKKKALTQFFSCEFCKIFQSTLFIEHLRVTTSVNTLLDQIVFLKVTRKHFVL